MIGLHTAFALVVAVLIAGKLFKGREPKTAAVLLVVVGWAALVLGDFTAELIDQISHSGSAVVEVLFRTTAGAGLVIGSLLELLDKRSEPTA